MTRQLRPRQAQAITDLREAYRAGYRAPILVAPTGFGKTDTAVPIVRSAVARGRRVGFLAHLKEILDDTSDRLLEAGIGYGSIRSGRSADYSQSVQMISVQTAAKRDRLPPLDMLIVDECHLAIARSYVTSHEGLGRPIILGLTATAQRLDGRPLGEMFDVLVPTCSTLDLVEEGLLVPIRMFNPNLVTLPGRRGKNFDNEEDGAILSEPAIVGDALSHWKRYCHGRRGVIFCSSVSHAHAIADQWRRAGYRAMAIDGNSEDDDRKEARDGLKAGRLDVVACARLWIAGVDVPEIDAVMWLRRTTSLVDWLQGNGRGLRLAPWVGKKDLVIIDPVGNSDPSRLDHPYREWEWSLEGKAKKKAEQSISVKTCPKCFAAMPSARPRCSECGHVFTAAPRQELQQIDGELIEREFQKRERRREQGHAQTIADLVELGRQRGMKNPHGWARHVHAAREAKAGRVPA
jgi:superfamily II DNA or RNA helicase